MPSSSYLNTMERLSTRMSLKTKARLGKEDEVMK